VHFLFFFLIILLKRCQKRKSKIIKQVEITIEATQTSNSFLTVGLIKIDCDSNGVNSKLIENCQIISTIQQQLKNQQKLHKVTFPIQPKYAKNITLKTLFVIIFHLGTELETPTNVIKNGFHSFLRSGKNPQYSILELLPHCIPSHLKVRSVSTPINPLRKNFLPISLNQNFQINLKVPIKKTPTKGRPKASSSLDQQAPRLFVDDMTFDLTIKWSSRPLVPTSRPLPTTAPNEQPSDQQKGSSSKIFYHFLTKNSPNTSSTSLVEMHQIIQCPWCRYPQHQKSSSSQLEQETNRTHDETSVANCHPPSAELLIQASPDLCQAITTWTNLGSTGGKIFNPYPSTLKTKRKYESMSSSGGGGGNGESEYIQFYSSSFWSSSTRQRIRALLIHLNTFHSHFQYQYFCDRLLNLHIMISRLSPINDLPSPITTTTGGGGGSSRRASPISISSSTSSSQEGGFLLPRGQPNFVFYGKSWRNLFTEDFPILLLKTIHCDPSLRLSSSVTESTVGRNNGNESSDPLTSLPQEDDLTSGHKGDNILLSSSLPSQSIPLPPPPHPNNSLPRTRQYFHSNGRLIEPCEEMYDSDEDINTSWEHIHSYDLINEFQDISGLEKKFMIIWNTFLNSFPIYADRYMGVALEIFVRRYGLYLIENGLRHILLLHLMTMWDFSLINFHMIMKCIELVDQSYHHHQQQQSFVREGEGEREEERGEGGK
jgi:hypothetical protein